jgi:hypothetical protein
MFSDGFLLLAFPYISCGFFFIFDVIWLLKALWSFRLLQRVFGVNLFSVINFILNTQDRATK